jgi:predicted nucleic acid-binding protein
VYFPYLDASALAKRYAPEAGSPVVDHLFARVPRDRMIVFSVGLAEVVSILVRKRNAGTLGARRYRNALRLFRTEFNGAASVHIIASDGPLAKAAYGFVETYSLNSTDALILRSALDAAALLRPAGDDLLLVSSDRRLIQAARREGVTAFNPEVESIPALDALLGP